MDDVVVVLVLVAVVSFVSVEDFCSLLLHEANAKSIATHNEVKEIRGEIIVVDF